MDHRRVGEGKKRRLKHVLMVKCLEYIVGVEEGGGIYQNWDACLAGHQSIFRFTRIQVALQIDSSIYLLCLRKAPQVPLQVP